jgi:hypothetical protein
MRFLVACLFSTVMLSSAYAQEPIRTQPEPDDDEITVTGRVERPVPAPPGDPRTDAQRMRDIRSWDRCIIRAQSVAGGSDDPTRYQPLSPEEFCSRQLGMADRRAVPISRE